jgi:hypothetical protein
VWKFTLNQSTQDVVVFHIPDIGYVFMLLSLRKFRIVLVGLPATIIGSRQQTKDRIAELFFKGETQGNVPPSGLRSTRSSSTATGYARSARAPSASAVRWTTPPRRPARCSSSPPPKTPEPGEQTPSPGHQANARRSSHTGMSSDVPKLRGLRRMVWWSCVVAHLRCRDVIGRFL